MIFETRPFEIEAMNFNPDKAQFIADWVLNQTGCSSSIRRDEMGDVVGMNIDLGGGTFFEVVNSDWIVVLPGGVVQTEDPFSFATKYRVKKGRR